MPLVMDFISSQGPSSPDGWAVWGVVLSTRWWLLVDHCVLRNWDRIPVRAVEGLISRVGIVSICSLLWQRDVKLQQTKPPRAHQRVTYLPIPESAVPNDGANKVYFAHNLGSLYLSSIWSFSCIWLFFQINLIIINHRHWPSLAAFSHRRWMRCPYMNVRCMASHHLL